MSTATPSPSSQAYLRNAVLTASPEHLQLMLYDGAIRFALQGREAITAKNWEQVYEKLSRAQRIVLEMDGGLRPDVAPEICARMSALYNFVYRRLVDGCVNHDVEAVDDALRILRYERETWTMLMAKLTAQHGSAPPPEQRPTAGSLSIEG
jgi:flagellar protein FliS